MWKKNNKTQSLKVTLYFQEKEIRCDPAAYGMQDLGPVMPLAPSHFVISEPTSKLLKTDSRR